MTVLYLVIPLALVLVAVALAAFAWALRDGQFDDLHTPAVRILHDEEDAGEDKSLNRGQRVEGRGQEKKIAKTPGRED
ncbi:MAG TPA: cbb3-type cytochrome oxidase assembly protein CcoS [Phycisphaeraceae bacterium]